MNTTLQRCLPEQAHAWIDRWPRLDATEVVAARSAVGRRLAKALLADADEPPELRVAVDGYALQAAQTEGASDYNPLPLRLCQSGPVSASTVVPVCSGDILPVGADAVLPLELAGLAGKCLEVAGTVACGEGLIQPGEECRAGQTLLAAGHCLRPLDPGWLALNGVTLVTVYRRPRVRVLLAGTYHREVDGVLLSTLLARDGAALLELRSTPDALSLGVALGEPGADLLLVVGGSGLGNDDHAVQGLAEQGEVAHHGVAIHPGDSVALGCLGETPVIVLPGTPLACLCAYDLLACRLVRRLAGCETLWPYRGETLPLSAKISSRLGRLECCRVQVQDGQALPLAISEGRLLRSFAQADGLVLVPVHSEGYAAGTEVTVYRF